MTTINEPTRLQAARAAVDEAAARLTDISRQMAELSAAAQRKRDQAAAAMAPKQEKRGILARILKRGGMPELAETTELKALDKRIAQAATDADTATTEAEVIGEMLAELQAESDTIHATMQSLHRELAEAQFEAARAEIEGEALPEFFAAAEAFRQAYGKLVGLGLGHHALHSAAIGIGAGPGQAIGASLTNAIRLVQIALPGFATEERLRGHPTLRGHNFVMLQLNVYELTDAIAAEALARWQKA